MSRFIFSGLAFSLFLIDQSLPLRYAAAQSRDYETLEAHGGSADATSANRTDNADAWDAAIAAGIVHCRPIRLLGGHYYFKRAAVADFSHLGKMDCVPSIEGSGSRLTYLHFARQGPTASGSAGIAARRRVEAE